ncbi:hypothetical protein D9615_009133 [Tricholomella constricta]|uniref:ATPase AAA-type core domain-containing protein n=1 Tax=Tricholomella constricta TaxID=117010 RepID=A0A8H5H0T0_9AGAR|nr:hypothetical protein D9615_009133 [Tricholomella constricta]
MYLCPTQADLTPKLRSYHIRDCQIGAAARTSTATDPNAIAFRSVLKGLIIALVELVPVEEFANLEELVDIWISLFGCSESQSISGICAQYWQADWHNDTARRAIFDPLIRLLRSMTASGFLDYDTLSIASHLMINEAESISEEHDVCVSHVFYYTDKLPTFTQVVPLSACSGAHALYEKLDRQRTTEVVYTNIPIKLPGGSTLSTRSMGRSLSDGGDYTTTSTVVACSQDLEQVQGVHIRTCSSGEPDGSQVKVIKLEDVGIEPNEGGDGEVVMRCLDLVRSLIQDSPAQAEQLMQALETGEPVVAHTVTESQLTTMILEDALSTADPRTRTQPRPQLIISATSVLSNLLALPNCSNRVWLYIRSTTALFGDERAAGFASGALAAGRATEHYTMTLELLHPVQQLYREAAASVLPDNPRLQQLKEDVLLRAAHFIHTEIWVGMELGDRFEIGRRVTAMYIEVLEHAPPTLEERPFVALSQAVVDVLLFKATSSTITLSCRQYTLTARASGTYMQLDAASRPGLLKEALCARISGGVSVHSPKRAEVDPIDVLALYVKERDAGTVMPVEAPSPSTIIDHVSNQEATVAVFVRIVQHPYDGIRGGRNRRGEQLSDVNALSLSGLLNALDGVAAAEGRLLFATTNHLDRLDPALSRPGRMDVWVEFKNASKWQAEALFRNFFPSTEDDLTEAEAESTSPAPGSSFGHGSSNGSDSRPSSTLWSMSPSFSSSSVASSFLVNTPLVSHPLVAHWRHCPTVPYGSDIDDGEPFGVSNQTYLRPPIEEHILSSQHSAMPLDAVTLGILAKKFADGVPEEEFSVAALQGSDVPCANLLKNKSQPEAAANGVGEWVIAERDMRETTNTTAKIEIEVEIAIPAGHDDDIRRYTSPTTTSPMTSPVIAAADSLAVRASLRRLTRPWTPRGHLVGVVVRHAEGHEKGLQGRPADVPTLEMCEVDEERVPRDHGPAGP